MYREKRLPMKKILFVLVFFFIAPFVMALDIEPSKDENQVREALNRFLDAINQGEEVYTYLDKTNQKLYTNVTEYLGKIHRNGWIKSVKEIEKNLMKSKQPLSQKAIKKEKEKWNATENK